jgi:hypothetical protein
MNFDDLYYLKLAIRLSDYNGVNKYLSKNKSKLDIEVYDYLNYYCTDIRIFKLFDKFKAYINPYTMAKTTFNNTEVFKHYLNNGVDINRFKDTDESVLTNILNNKNLTKRAVVFEYLLTRGDLDLNSKNSNAETNSQIMLKVDPTSPEGVYLEKLERLTKDMNEKNSFLFTNRDVLTNNTQSIDNFVEEPVESLKINFHDIEFHLLGLNLKLKRMFSFTQINLSERDSTYKTLSELHLSILHNFILNKLLLDKI